ncbi:MAG: ABC transporter permease [Alphaproteobacteria bacterium]|nr:ABC transporter permease [Alphaproteobacteria bacterium]
MNSTLSTAWAARFFQTYAVLIMIAILIVALSFLSDSFLTFRNLQNILNQNAPLAIMASAMTLVIIGGGFDLSVGSIFAVAGVSAAWIALNVDPFVGLAIAPFIGLALGMMNGIVITSLNIHSFLATIATSMVFKGVAILITDGRLIPVRLAEFTWLGRDKVGGIFIAVIVMVLFALALTFVLTRTAFGRKVYSVGGNEEAAILSGVRTNRVKIATFAIAGMAAGLAAAISVSRISMGQPGAGIGMELQAIAAVILGGTSIYGGSGAVWRSVAGVLLLALINNGFNILNADPFYRDLTTGLIILAAVGISASGQRR